MMANVYPPGPGQSWPEIFLSTLEQRDRLSFLEKMTLTYGDLVHFRTGSRHIYLLNDPDAIYQILVEQADNVHRTEPVKRALGTVLGQGLLMSDGAFHDRQRRMMQPAFHYQRVTTYAEIMVSNTQQLIDHWQPGQKLDICREMMTLTLSIVAKTLFDADVSEVVRALSDAITRLQTAVIRQFGPHLWLPTPINLRERQALKTLNRIVMNIIDQRQTSNASRGDLLSMLLLSLDDAGQPMSRQQVRDEAVNLIIAGHETTANWLNWTWCLLSQNTDAASKLSEELMRVLAGRTPTVEDIPHLPYLGMIMKEALRLYPPVWILSRQVIQDVTLRQYLLRKDSVIVISPYLIHRHPQYFPEPERFLPERFASDTDANLEKRLPRFAYFPFGGGPRVCIGQSFAVMEATLIMATIAQRFRLALVPGQQIAIEPLITLRAKGGLQMMPTLCEQSSI